MKEKSYYSITTRKFTLRCGHPEWLQTTQDFYNKIVLFYYDLYLDLWESGQREELAGQQALRKLEQLSILGRDRQPVPYPLPWKRVPLYFRRSAANKGIAAGRSFIARKSRILEAEHQDNQYGIQYARSIYFQQPVTFYKGMYRDLSDCSVDLKVWNGQEWCFLHCRLNANTIPEEGSILSPSVILRGKEMHLYIPVRTPVSDGRKTGERLRCGARICVVQFAAGDVFAVGLISNIKGEQLGVLFFRGGNEYTHSCSRLLKKIDMSKQARGSETGQEKSCLDKENKRYWLKIKNINDFYSNNVSRQVINYCKKNNVEIIVIPKYEEKYSRYVMNAVGNCSATHLSTRIREQIQYKAWQSGILVIESAPYGCGSICSICGAALTRKGMEYICENGHRGNRYLNSARNLLYLFIKNMKVSRMIE